MDERIQNLARILVEYSCRVQPEEKVLISVTGAEPYALVRALIKNIYNAGGYPYVELLDQRIQRELLMGVSAQSLAVQSELELARIQKMDAYIGVRGGENLSESSDVPAERMALYARCMDSAFTHRVKHTKWVVLRYPNASMAQSAKMSTEAFEDFYFSVCTLDYSKMNKAMQPLKTLMEKTDRVRIVGKGTDLSFSIKGIPSVICSGEMNIPDGEIYTAPVRDSINGTLTYNTPSLYKGFVFENISFTFANGKIVKAGANDTKRLNQILDIDEGARYVGEFALGVNPYITNPMLDTLFDEKIAGSFHFTPGSCYDDAPNGNVSSEHWDLVCIQTPSCGGGEIYFDDVLVRKDGRFVPDALQGLNPENLM